MHLCWLSHDQRDARNLVYKDGEYISMNRRKFIYGMGTLAAVAAIPTGVRAIEMFGSKDKSKKGKGDYPFYLSDAQWKERLTPEQYKILRRAGTERSLSSPLHLESRGGEYHCAGCEHLLFTNKEKFISKSGWPSFYAPARADGQSVGEKTDYKIGFPRTEIHCNNCGGHLGHVFKDGPAPTGLRYCINGIALAFTSRD